MLRTIIYIILLLWLLGWIFGAALHIAGGLIHTLLLIALILFLLDYFGTRRTRL